MPLNGTHLCNLYFCTINNTVINNVQTSEVKVMSMICYMASLNIVLGLKNRNF